jgi:hypothetical protein
MTRNPMTRHRAPALAHQEPGEQGDADDDEDLVGRLDEEGVGGGLVDENDLLVIGQVRADDLLGRTQKQPAEPAPSRLERIPLSPPRVGQWMRPEMNCAPRSMSSARKCPVWLRKMPIDREEPWGSVQMLTITKAMIR